jgi:hypothetical protein
MFGLTMAVTASPLMIISPKVAPLVGAAMAVGGTTIYCKSNHSYFCQWSEYFNGALLRLTIRYEYEQVD